MITYGNETSFPFTIMANSRGGEQYEWNLDISKLIKTNFQTLNIQRLKSFIYTLQIKSEKSVKIDQKRNLGINKTNKKRFPFQINAVFFLIFYSL